MPCDTALVDDDFACERIARVTDNFGDDALIGKARVGRAPERIEISAVRCESILACWLVSSQVQHLRFQCFIFRGNSRC